LFHSLYDLLLELATWPGSQKSSTKECNDERRNWSAISCSVLLSLCIARGDTGKMIKAITSILMSSNSLLTQSIKLPDILIKLQKSVECAALGKLEKPRFYEYGVPKESLIDEFPVKNLTSELGYPSLSLASDGKYLYILHGKSLYKIGSGYSGTTKGLIYKMNLDFTKDKRGWIGFCQNKLYYKKLSKRSIENFILVDRESLTLQNPLTSSVPPMKRDANNFTLYSDGDSINAISAIKDTFVIREIIPPTSDFPFDITLNLSKRSFKTFGYTPFEEEILNHSQLQKIQTSFNCFIPALPDEAEVFGIVAGKEFGLVMTSSSKVYYYGKGASLGIKSLIKSPSLKLSELTISKVSKIVQTSLFHDGLHALLMSNDGSVFFAGTARRGEDGEISKRRLLKPIKPKRISRLDNHFIINVSSNNGTSAFVTKTGKLIMYGKDTGFCDPHGIVHQLQDQHIIKVALGKAHAIALNSKGEIFSFGVNNKGQCGRTFSQTKDKQAPSASNSDFTSKYSTPQRHVYLCEVDEHEVTEDHCKICKICFECTGYNKMCSAASKITIQNRIGGSKCFCGHGNSGCIKCGACATCITKQESELDNHIVLAGSPPLQVNEKQQNKIVVKKEVRIDAGDEVNVSNESERVAPLAPGKVIIPSNSPVVQISCGLHHTVVLTAAGEVFTFGSNQYGQLGTGNLEPTSSPYQVKIPAGMAGQVAAGSNHTVVLSSNGVVYTFGNNQKGQLGRPQPTEIQSSSQTPPQGSKSSFTFNEFQFHEVGDVLTQRQRLNCIPTAISGIGPNFRKKACWISASGDQTFVKVDESLINASYLNRISIAANKNTIVFISNNESIPGCITINKHDGKCITHSENQFPFFDIAPIPPFISDHDIVESTNPFLNSRLASKDSGDHSSSSSPSTSSITSVNNTVFTFDPLYDVLWGFDVTRKTVMCFNILASKVLSKKSNAIFKADITLPKKNTVDVTRVQACLNILACLDTLALDANILDSCFEADSSKLKQHKNVETVDSLKESKETKKICRFDAFGGGWGYFGHSVEAVRFMCDTDIVMDGIGMYGGRGEYTCKIKLFDLDFDGGAVEKEGNLVLEIEDVPYFCPARTIHNIMFQKPVNIVAGKWYLLWVKVSGPSSDCGSSGQNIVVGDDQVVFTFKSSKKSNNGTDINSGQIPSIIYRVVTHDRKLSTEISRNEEICKISKQFINKISPESFENLVKLLNWSWSQFKQKVNEVEVEKISSSDELLINRYVYICQVCLRLLKKYINEIYPSDSFKGIGENETSIVNKSFHSNAESSSKNNQLPTSSLSVLSETGVSSHSSRKVNVENIQLAENVVNVRALLITILCDDLTNTCKKSNLIFEIMDECNNTFVSCFNAFYPTSFLKWDCLCDLLSQLDKGVLYSRLLSSVLAGLAYDPTVNLKATFSIMSSHATEQKAITSPSENSGQPILQNAENYPYPVLVEQMMYNTQKEKSNPIYSSWNFKEILTRLLDIISRPIKLKIESVYNSSKMDLVSSEYLRKTNDFNLISNCCFLLSKTLAEIVYQSSATDADPTVVSPYVLQSTNVRFKKSDYSKTWNTGNFASDAICFTVDRPGIVLAGCCVYYGSGSYEYQLELFHDILDSKSMMQHKWEVIETTYGKYDQENVHRNMVQLKFERPVPIRENTCYALRFCSQGARTCSGDSGYQFVRGPCGTVFRFYPCDLSFNGTSPHRGQLPCLLYYSVPISHQGSKLKNNKEMLARDIALEFASDVIQRSCDLLTLARGAFLYALSSSSDKSSSNSSNTTQTFDSEHNITPIEEHFDVTWMTNVPSTATPMIKQPSFPYYSSSSQSPVNKDPTNMNFKDVSKKIETFSRGIMETLKLDKKFDRNSDCVEIKIDNASEVNPNDFLDDEQRVKKRVNEDVIDSNINGNTTKKPTSSNQLEKSESCESLGGADREKLNEMFTMEESSLFHTLLPLTVAHLGRLICSDPKISVEILNLVKMILPQISLWNQISNRSSKSCVKAEECYGDNGTRLSTTSNHYAVIESDHPYKLTSIYSYKVEFPSNVKWMSLEFDPLCGTAQPEDCLKIFIPVKSQNSKSTMNHCERGKVKVQKNIFDNSRQQQTTVNEQQQILIKKFNTENSWPTNLIIVPGNEISLSLETASNYLTDHKLNRYGFKCILVGYENIDMSKTFNNSLVNLESEFAYLGGMCSANLMRKDLIFSGKNLNLYFIYLIILIEILTLSDEKTDDFWATENILKKHSVLLSKGLSIRDGSLTMNNILEYDIIE
jgi:RCR-type E3 ubiquitin transferase